MRRDRKGSEGDEIKEKEKKKEIQKDEKKLTPAEHVFARFIPSLIIELKNYENQFQEEKRKLTNGLKRLQSLKDLKLKTKASDKGEPIFSDPAKTEKHYKTILEELTKVEKKIAIALKSLETAKNKLISVSEDKAWTIEKIRKDVLQPLQSPIGDVLNQASHLQTKIAVAFDELVSDEKATRDDAALCKQLEEWRDDFAEISKEIHQNCYHPIAIEAEDYYRKESEKVNKINVGLQKIYDQLGMAEEKLDKLGLDTAGINNLKNTFTQALLCGTIHADHLKEIIIRIKGMIDTLEREAPQTKPMCHAVREELDHIAPDLLSWRKTTTEYLLSLTVKFGVSAILNSASVVFPLFPITTVSSISSQVAAPIVSSAIEKGGTIVTAISADKVSTSLSSKSLHRVPKEDKHIPGNFKINIESKGGDDKGSELVLSTEHLWQDTMYLDIISRWAANNKIKLSVAGLSMAIGIPLLVTGVATPLGMALMAGGGAAVYLSMDVFSENRHLQLEKGVMQRIYAQLIDPIEAQFLLLELGQFRGNLHNYRKETLDFINEEIERLAPADTIKLYQELRHLPEHSELVKELEAAEEKIRELKKLKAILEEKKEEHSLGKSINFIDLSDHKTPPKEIIENFETAKLRVAEVENGLNILGITSPFQLKLHQAEEKFKNAEREFTQPISDEMKRTSEEKKGADRARMVLTPGFFETHKLQEKGKAASEAQFELRCLQVILPKIPTVSLRHKKTLS